MRKIGILFNRHAGMMSYEKEIATFCDSLPKDKFLIQIKEFNKDEDLKEASKELLDGDFDTIVAAGGDGTISAVAQNLLKTRVKMGIIPIGTLNHLAKDLNIPIDVDQALILITGEHQTIKIDAASCNGIIFLNNSGLGIYPRIVELREKFQKDGHLKWLAFFIALFHVSNRIPKQFVKFKIGKETISKKTSFLFVGNNIYGLGGLKTGSRDSLSDGLLSLWISHRTSLFGMMELLFRAIFGNVKEHRDFDIFEAEEITVETKKNISVSFDGEVSKVDSPLCYKIEPKCLNVIVPIKQNE